MVELKPVLQVFLLILGSMAAAWVVVEIRDHIWPRPVISLPYDDQVVFERSEQVADELETVKAHRAITEAKLVGKSHNTLGDSESN